MKRSSENDNSNGSNSSGNSSCSNWLGFSLSPYMKMEGCNSSVDEEEVVHHDYHHHYTHHHQVQPQQQQQQSTVGMFVSHPLPQQQQQQQLNSGPICFENGDGGGENGGYFHTPLTVMPLKSDGSLCLMEAFNRSHPPEGSHLFYTFTFILFILCLFLWPGVILGFCNFVMFDWCY